ncbi:hypothetical protein KH5H1_23970 [Corallococcus caeni]|nr:hypothetical protein KH5H1_23970 [Corallococcus sp. KH5-1]
MRAFTFIWVGDLQKKGAGPVAQGNAPRTIKFIRRAGAPAASGPPGRQALCPNKPGPLQV